MSKYIGIDNNYSLEINRLANLKQLEVAAGLKLSLVALLLFASPSPYLFLLISILIIGSFHEHER